MVSAVDRDVWIAAAASPSLLPAVGSQVYYFPHGHAEQCRRPTPPIPHPHLFTCTVHSVDLFADAITDEPYATITLLPGPHLHTTTTTTTTNPDEDGFRCYAKQLTQSDANNGGGFSVPRSCADSIFPSLDFKADPPVQNLLMRDLLGNTWSFRHIYRGTPRRHLFTTGWTKFVNAKLLVAGDTVVFIHRPNGELVVGVRRYHNNSRARGVPTQEVLDSLRHATKGDTFTVTYYPPGGFVVPRKDVDDALATAWFPGAQVRMQVMDAEDRRYDWINGVVKAVDSHMWRMLQIEWDIAESPTKENTHVNPWEIQLVGYPPLPKKLRISEDAAIAEPLIGSEIQKMFELVGSHIPLGIQGARPTHVPSSSSSRVFTTELDLFHRVPIRPSSSSTSSEVVNPETESPPNNSVNMVSAELINEVKKSIQLFGTTIAPPIKCASSAEASQVPNAVVDGTANEDASAPSPPDCCARKDALSSESVN